MTRKIHAKTEEVNVEDLYWGVDDIKPRDVDWSTLSYDSWEVIQPYTEEDFEKYSDDPHEYNDDAEDALGYGDMDTMRENNQPMMNYCYSLGERDTFDAEDARALGHLNLCLVHFTETEEHALALTGGGMDLSWDIVEAYIRLGYVPPVHFARLPRYAGHTMTPARRIIIRALLRALKGTIAHHQQRIEDLEKMDANPNGAPL